MTIKELVKEHIGFSYEVDMEDLLKLCQEVRKLTIEECKKKVEAYIPFYEGNTYYAEIDFDTFPTDLNNIDI